ncbi:hypothetical protein [Cohnella yongneupensis]|uniref:Uncharacterized protein n=1 Tax=Cohnella yongneupensis TaxID=425006 RepID=A0ABW0QVH6_9BACL
MNHVASLGDNQVAQIIERGTAVVLVLMQEELVDLEQGKIYPAKSYTIDRQSNIIQLRDFLNKTFPPS